LFRRLVNLLLLILIVNAIWRAGPAFYGYFVYRDQVFETARWSAGRSEDQVKQILVDMARRSGLPVREGDVVVQKIGPRIVINVVYTQPIEVVPFYEYNYDFSVSVATVLIRASSVKDLR